MGAETKVVAVSQKRERIIRLAKPAGTFDDGLKNRPDVGWRRCDHAEDVGAASLVSERLGEVARLGLHLVEQSHVLDRDYGLVGEGRNQFDLLVRERCNRPAAQVENADGMTLA